MIDNQHSTQLTPTGHHQIAILASNPDIRQGLTAITQDCDIVPILEEAFDVSTSGIPGPVFIECPLDLLYDREMVEEVLEGIRCQNKVLRSSLMPRGVMRRKEEVYRGSPQLY